MSPKISIVIPTYNRAGLISETIKSILEQSMKDFELLIIDDGSIDSTKEVIESFLSDSRVKYFLKENGGEPSAVNYGWKIASGEYFAQINSDDPILPGLLEEMSDAMDQHAEAIVGYCDFNFIDENGLVIKSIRNPNWNFQQQLKNFSCVAASPGTFYRKSKLSHWKDLRQYNYSYINDVAMLWDMALEGDFIHVQKVLASWRQHPNQISNSRYLAIPEIEDWFDRYFSKKGLPQHIKECRKGCLNSIQNYSQKLINESRLSENEKFERLFTLKKKRLLGDHKYINLQVGDQDLVGNKFNGHDLHLLLQNQGVQSIHCVQDKNSDDIQTVRANKNNGEDFSRWLLRSELFSYSDIIHLHLIHNTDFDINLLPIMTQLKPMVITLHDPFFLGGHCIHHHDCEKWKDQCFNCQYLDTLFAVKDDISAIQHFEKKTAFQNSNISIIVASKWMERKVKISPVFKGKKIYHIPFGINQDIFKPLDHDLAKQNLAISKESFVIMFRSDISIFKGLDVIKDTLRKVKFNTSVTLLCVGQRNQMNEFKDKFKILDFGWILDDLKLASLYQACDVFLMPSRQETFGMMAIEAMSCGKTVLALNGTALPDTINSPDCGIAVNENEYINVFQNLVNSQNELHLHGEASLEYAKLKYNIQKYTDSILETYSEIMHNFIPNRSSEIVIEQLMKKSLKTMDRSADLNVLYRTFSWRITKSMRAFRGARLIAPKGLKAQISFFIKYLGDKHYDRIDDVAIQNSIYWKITQPLRKFGLPKRTAFSMKRFYKKVKSVIKSRLHF
jgi:glycosyltransferase involved in cell wall biosynthesis